MTDHLSPSHDPHELLRTAAVILGPASGDVDAHMRRLVDMAAQVAASIDNVVQRLGRAGTEQIFRGVLVGVEQLDRGKVRYSFLPTVGKYAGKYIDPQERAREGSTPYDTKRQARFQPFVETWTSDFLSDRTRPTSAAGDLERSAALIGRHVSYRTHRDQDGDAPIGGYRCFDGFIGEVDLPDPSLAPTVTHLAAELGVTYLAPDDSGGVPAAPARHLEPVAEPAPVATIDYMPGGDPLGFDDPDRVGDGGDERETLYNLVVDSIAALYELAQTHFGMAEAAVNAFAGQVLGPRQPGVKRTPDDFNRVWRTMVHDRYGEAA